MQTIVPVYSPISQRATVALGVVLVTVNLRRTTSITVTPNTVPIISKMPNQAMGSSLPMIGTLNTGRLKLVRKCASHNRSHPSLAAPRMISASTNNKITGVPRTMPTPSRSVPNIWADCVRSDAPGARTGRTNPVSGITKHK